MGTLFYYIKKLIPRPLFAFVQPAYHYALSLAAALWYRFPAREVTVIGVTGTKGKSTVVELLGAFFEADGKRVALSSTIRFKVDQESARNQYKMTMPGRFFVQRFLRRAVEAGCDIVILEMTSEGVKQFRHKWIDLDALVFTNLSPEHIESHGSFEKYVAAKLELARLLERSRKRPRRMIANADDERGSLFLAAAVEEATPYSLADAELYTLAPEGANIVIDNMTIRTPLVGVFNVSNALGAIACARAFGLSLRVIEAAFAKLPPIRGRVEQIHSPRDAAKRITAIVDYAHTPDSLEKLYQAFPHAEKVCVLGNTGGGRDTWKRPEMGRIAGVHCSRVILTNEDPYDEDPEAIVREMHKGIADRSKVEVIMDRRKAIRVALGEAPDDSVVFVTGKGTDPYIMGPHGMKEKWDDATIVREEMERLFGSSL